MRKAAQLRTGAWRRFRDNVPAYRQTSATFPPRLRVPLLAVGGLPDARRGAHSQSRSLWCLTRQSDGTLLYRAQGGATDQDSSRYMPAPPPLSELPPASVPHHTVAAVNGSRNVPLLTGGAAIGRSVVRALAVRLQPQIPLPHA